ncbi:Zn-dependent hydrolase [Anaerocolumna sp. AGMB13020]|uniref:Zn-dependent hydrolase n=1 Tax=Anaerocolumna sp. AGMB13020 TaxID=3081750 RepID=UPI0029546B6A|nr:Zn-dependent hydrolase [Anaerocolumna sp. AGMB13020]WOO37027.1 Zn-dependent hydrolase [Anaerocolumna sp. AGMB13020]
MKINLERLEKNLKELSLFGRKEDGGIDRSLGNEAEEEARSWLLEKALDMGAAIKIDAMANIWINWKTNNSDNKPITLGSHHDAVSDGGMYDGALGVLMGLEIMQTLKENQVPLEHPLQVVSFTAEEPNPFQISTMGSRGVTGKLTLEKLQASRHLITGESLGTAIKRAGGNIQGLLKAQVGKKDMAAFIECHIEQGRNLFDNKLSAGTVTKITGIYREFVTVKGEANHAGTTRMEYRHDAFLAAAQAALVVEETAKALKRRDVVATVGWVEVNPNSANIISGNTKFIMELRFPGEMVKQQMLQRIEKDFLKIENNRGISFQREIILDQAPAPMDEGIMKIIGDEISKEQTPLSLAAEESSGLEFINHVPMLVSMAGHDAVHMSGITRTGMIFVQSIEGKSHCREEKTDGKDIEIAGNALLNAVLRLDKELTNENLN